ncbi:MAG: hypothetical protein JSR33_09560, partial [Proteobacteria bacterium]|nr:hypothetical protein [Pseudomonadota bacterium]
LQQFTFKILRSGALTKLSIYLAHILTLLLRVEQSKAHEIFALAAYYFKIGVPLNYVRLASGSDDPELIELVDACNLLLQKRPINTNSQCARLILGNVELSKRYSELVIQTPLWLQNLYDRIPIDIETATMDSKIDILITAPSVELEDAITKLVVLSNYFNGLNEQGQISYLEFLEGKLAPEYFLIVMLIFSFPVSKLKDSTEDQPGEFKGSQKAAISLLVQIQKEYIYIKGKDSILKFLPLDSDKLKKVAVMRTMASWLNRSDIDRTGKEILAGLILSYFDDCAKKLLTIWKDAFIYYAEGTAREPEVFFNFCKLLLNNSAQRKVFFDFIVVEPSIMGELINLNSFDLVHQTETFLERGFRTKTKSDVAGYHNFSFGLGAPLDAPQTEDGLLDEDTQPLEITSLNRLEEEKAQAVNLFPADSKIPDSSLIRLFAESFAALEDKIQITAIEINSKIEKNSCVVMFFLTVFAIQAVDNMSLDVSKPEKFTLLKKKILPKIEFFNLSFLSMLMRVDLSLINPKLLRILLIPYSNLFILSDFPLSSFIQPKYSLLDAFNDTLSFIATDEDSVTREDCDTSDQKNSHIRTKYSFINQAVQELSISGDMVDSLASKQACEQLFSDYLTIDPKNIKFAINFLELFLSAVDVHAKDSYYSTLSRFETSLEKVKQEIKEDKDALLNYRRIRCCLVESQSSRHSYSAIMHTNEHAWFDVIVESNFEQVCAWATEDLNKVLNPVADEKSGSETQLWSLNSSTLQSFSYLLGYLEAIQKKSDKITSYKKLAWSVFFDLSVQDAELLFLSFLNGYRVQVSLEKNNVDQLVKLLKNKITEFCASQGYPENGFFIEHLHRFLTLIKSNSQIIFIDWNQILISQGIKAYLLKKHLIIGSEAVYIADELNQGVEQGIDSSTFFSRDFKKTFTSTNPLTDSTVKDSLSAFYLTNFQLEFSSQDEHITYQLFLVFCDIIEKYGTKVVADNFREFRYLFLQLRIDQLVQSIFGKAELQKSLNLFPRGKGRSPVPVAL